MPKPCKRTNGKYGCGAGCQVDRCQCKDSCSCKCDCKPCNHEGVGGGGSEYSCNDCNYSGRNCD